MWEESGLAAVDPVTVGETFSRMKKMMMKEVAAKGILGLYSEQ
jgi:hypothetical protein